jgi:hypothetical protein
MKCVLNQQDASITIEYNANSTHRHPRLKDAPAMEQHVSQHWQPLQKPLHPSCP